MDKQMTVYIAIGFMSEPGQLWRTKSQAERAAAGMRARLVAEGYTRLAAKDFVTVEPRQRRDMSHMTVLGELPEPVSNYDLPAFERAYLECALWASMDDDGNSLDAGRDVSDFSRSAVKTLVKDCADFQEGSRELLAQAYATGHYNATQAGHDFWLTRHHHGAGFWDRGLGALGEKLTKNAHPFGECELYVKRGKVFCG